MRSLSNLIKSDQYVYDFISNTCSDEPNNKISESDIISAIKEREKQAIIKSQEIIDEAVLKANEIISKAKAMRVREMKSIVERLDRESEYARKRGYDIGFEEGKSEGSKLGYNEGLEIVKSEYEEQINNAIENFENIMVSINSQKSSLVENYKSEIKELSFIIAKTIIKEELSNNSEKIGRIIESSIDQYKNNNELKVFISDHIFNLLLDNNFFNDLNKKYPNVKFISSNDLKDYDCIIETPNEIADYSIETQISNIKEALKDDIE